MKSPTIKELRQAILAINPRFKAQSTWKRADYLSHLESLRESRAPRRPQTTRGGFGGDPCSSGIWGTILPPRKESEQGYLWERDCRYADCIREALHSRGVPTKARNPHA